MNREKTRMVSRPRKLWNPSEQTDDLFAELDERPSNSANPNFELAAPEWLLGLMDLPKIGTTRALSLALHFRTVERFRSATPEEIYYVAKVKDLDVKDLKPRAPGSDAGVEVISYFSPNYPAGLRELTDAPLVLWLRGNIPEIPMTAIVGTRTPSEWGRWRAKDIGMKASHAGLGVVSGLALGIDTEAHEGALQAGGTTIAVIACDVRNPSPASNVELAERIIASGGALISEVPFNQRTEPRALVARNRIQAAISKSLVMVECGIPSGTLHTVQFAFGLSRKVAVCVPPKGQSDQAKSAGNILLASEGHMDSSLFIGQDKLRTLSLEKRPLADFLINDENSLKHFLRGE